MYPSQQNATDATASFFWYLILLATALILFWYFGRQYIIPEVFFVRKGEFYLIKWGGEAWNFFANYLHLPVFNLHPVNKVLEFMSTATSKAVNIDQFDAISAYMGKFFKYPVILVLVGLAWFLYFNHRTMQFAKTHSMKSLKKMGVELWPQITPVSTIDLVSKDLDEGPWAMAQLPKDFAEKHKIIKTRKIKTGQIVYSVDQGKAEQVMSLQMGSLWPGVDKLPIHIKALCLIFISKASRDNDISKHFLKQIAMSADGSGKLNFEGVNEALEKYRDHRLLKWLERRHAYVTTLMATFIEIARLDGVLATAQFLWLKPVDRRLWYVLNSVGRQTAVVEVVGPYAHWLAEKKVKRPLRAPMVKQAVEGLEESLSNILYIADEESWHTSSTD